MNDERIIKVGPHLPELS